MAATAKGEATTGRSASEPKVVESASGPRGAAAGDEGGERAAGEQAASAERVTAVGVAQLRVGGEQPLGRVDKVAVERCTGWERAGAPHTAAGGYAQLCVSVAEPRWLWLL